MSSYRAEGYSILIDRLKEFFYEHFRDFPVHDDEVLLDLVVAIDTKKIPEFLTRHQIEVFKDTDFFTYEFVNLMKLYSEFCKYFQKADMDSCDIIADQIYLLSDLYLPKIIDEDVIQEIKEWNFEAFGPGERLEGTIKHIKKELKEIEKEPHDLIEWIDVMMLAINGALRHGHEPQAIIDAFHKKFEINKNRKWADWRIVGKDQPITHIKSDDNAEV